MMRMRMPPLRDLFPTKWRNHNLMYILMTIELPLTVIILTLTGIASHDLYRTKLWQDGADNGFNSSPNERLYAAANHRSFKTPIVWSSFITEYNLVLGILSVFVWITKIPVHILHMLTPPLSAFVHAGLIAVYIYSVRYQAGPDMSDPEHPQPGAPWYITKKCSVAAVKTDVHYCMQAKALFAFSIILILYYVVVLGVSLQNCVMTKEERQEREELREERRTMKEFEDYVLKSPGIPMTVPRQTGPMPTGMPGKAPFHKTITRSTDVSSADLPLRQHFSSPNPRRSMHQVSAETLSGHQAQSQTSFVQTNKAGEN
ncbi:hypothetical protein AtubIFM55763_006251 [Aspergillus tubingensis]|nr:urate oxidase [Aspergillus tubingensis]GFN21473.1 urate oxidase [Aspergillus tubingensis]GLA66860.1 hypothetical protein AtubIFM54640_009448 [Aspergillus tubingensis]GLA74995.1 hypothetical protein AtubIFM55763_006251 [Aspergillus tubingensis]GLA89559.1 hypothetical protein AtubIFM56815_004041 [Aspergillus tubingensis]